MVIVSHLSGSSENVLSPNRFPDCLKYRTPYKCLTLLDPRHMDLYFDHDQMVKAKIDLREDIVFEKDREDAQGSTFEVTGGSVDRREGGLGQGDGERGNSLERRRAELLAIRNNNNRLNRSVGETFNSRLEKEQLDRFLELSGSVEIQSNPIIWYRDNSNDFTILSKYWVAYSSFPATSAASERVFNVDGLVLSSRRSLFILFKLKKSFCVN